MLMTGPHTWHLATAFHASSSHAPLEPPFESTGHSACCLTKDHLCILSTQTEGVRYSSDTRSQPYDVLHNNTPMEQHKQVMRRREHMKGDTRGRKSCLPTCNTSSNSCEPSNTSRVRTAPDHDHGMHALQCNLIIHPFSSPIQRLSSLLCSPTALALSERKEGATKLLPYDHDHELCTLALCTKLRLRRSPRNPQQTTACPSFVTLKETQPQVESEPPLITVYMLCSPTD